jgi:tagatose-1,6-bisphosphate aldolase
VDHETFCEQLRRSVQGGAAGFIAGRSLWKERMAPDERRAFLDGTVRRRFEELRALLQAHGDSARGVAPWQPRKLQDTGRE